MKRVLTAIVVLVLFTAVSWADIDPNVVQSALKGTVHVSCPQWQGSGFVITPNIIVTARHVIKDVEDFTITTQEGHVLKATRAISSKEYDVGFIYVDDLTCVAEKCEFEYPCGFTVLRGKHEVTLHPPSLGSIKDCRLGQGVFVIGSPYGKINFNSLTIGVISGVDRDWDKTDPWTGEKYGWQVAFTVDSAGHPGNSGCPVFTVDGVVRGILVGGFSPVLISVMPCDLFMVDLQMGAIELMFAMDRYRREEVVVEQGNYYNYILDNEYY